MVSNLQVKIYHIQLQIRSLLLLTELQDCTQEATQNTRKQCHLVCTVFGRMPHRNVPEGIEISIYKLGVVEIFHCDEALDSVASCKLPQ